MYRNVLIYIYVYVCVCVCVYMLLIFVYCYTVGTLKSQIFGLYLSLIRDFEDDPMRNRNISRHNVM